MPKKVFMLLVIMFSLIACTSTQQQIVQPTFIYSLSPTSPSNPTPKRMTAISKPYALPSNSSIAIVATITAPPPRFPPLELPDGLKIEEYIYIPSTTSSFVGVEKRHEVDSGKLIVGNVGNRGMPIELFLEGSVKVASIKINDKKWSITVSVQGKNVYDTEIANLSGASGLVEAWSYNNHWAIEVIPYPSSWGGVADVILDGQSLKNTFNYKSVFGFQLLGGKPFYFFKTNDGVGISYNSKNSGILYDDVRYRTFWIGYDPEPVQYENMVSFWATNQDKEYLVVMGLFKEE